MSCSEFELEGEVIAPDWLEKSREKLRSRWIETTKHQQGASKNTWACEIYHGCRECREHLSLPCSLLAEANEIGHFLSLPCFDSTPATFLRLYLVLLSEFVAQLNDAANLMDLRIGKPPKLVKLWANGWAKHRLKILLQHHPSILFEDQYQERWETAKPRVYDNAITDRCGNRACRLIIDTAWIEEADRKNALDQSYKFALTVIVVPRMQDFLDGTMQYFRRFVDACLADPTRVRKFENSNYRRFC